MNLEYNIYCDESCHLENDSSNVMVLGAIWCLKEKRVEICERIKEIKESNGINRLAEIKWNKVSPTNKFFFKQLVDYFFDNDDLHFRGIIIPNKKENFSNKTHDDFYYDMYFDLVKVIFDPQNSYNVYIDIKDTLGNEKVNQLGEVLRNNQYDYEKKIIKKIQQIRSHEIEILGLTDLIIGALSYLHRELKTSETKLYLIDRIKKRSTYSLVQSTLYKEEKFNVFICK